LQNEVNIVTISTVYQIVQRPQLCSQEQLLSFGSKYMGYGTAVVWNVTCIDWQSLRTFRRKLLPPSTGWKTYY